MICGAIINQYYKVVVEFERLGDYATNICETARDLYRKDVKLSETAISELDVLDEILCRILDETEKTFRNRDVDAAYNIEPYEEVVDDMVDIMRKNHLSRLSKGLCSVTAGTDFMDVLHDMERISDTCSNVGLATIARVHPELADQAHDYIYNLHTGKDEYFNLRYRDAHEKYYDRLTNLLDEKPEKSGPPVPTHPRT